MLLGTRRGAQLCAVLNLVVAAGICGKYAFNMVDETQPNDDIADKCWDLDGKDLQLIGTVEEVAESQMLANIYCHIFDRESVTKRNCYAIFRIPNPELCPISNHNSEKMTFEFWTILLILEVGKFGLELGMNIYWLCVPSGKIDHYDFHKWINVALGGITLDIVSSCMIVTHLGFHWDLGLKFVWNLLKFGLFHMVNQWASINRQRLLTRILPQNIVEEPLGLGHEPPPQNILQVPIPLWQQPNPLILLPPMLHVVIFYADIGSPVTSPAA